MGRKKKEGAKRGKEYWDDYWKDNKDKILMKRRRRYREDPEYANKVRERARAARLKSKSNPSASTAAGKKKNWRPLTVTHNGQQYTCHYISTMAEKVGRTTQTIDMWLRCGAMPPTPFVSDAGHRLFTDGMISSVSQFVAGKRHVDRKAMRAFLDKRWDAMGFAINCKGAE